MKKTLLYTLVSLCLCGCNDFLDTETYTKKNSASFPLTMDDVDYMLAGAYSIQNANNTVVPYTPFSVSEYASDERLGGSGENGLNIQSLDKLMVNDINLFENYWVNRYKGINRANMAIETIDNCKSFKDQAEHDRYLAEFYFLRGLYYWDLVQTFENIPMPLSTTPQNLAQSTPDEVYAQIGLDLTTAIKLFPNEKYDVRGSGHANRWSAEAFLARIFLFYTGFYEKTDMPLADGTSLTKQTVIDYLNELITDSGHGLVSDFRNLWSYSNELTKPDYAYSRDNNLCWEGDGNKEVIYAYKYGTIGGINPQGQVCRNYYVLNQGMGTSRGLKTLFPYGGGFCQGSVCPQLFEEWNLKEPKDVRCLGSIVDVATEIPNYFKEGEGAWEETKYRAKKFMPITAIVNGSIAISFEVPMWGMPNNQNTCHIQDLPLMRFADILLMQAELTQTVDGINQVRQRAGLDPISSFSMKALQDERRWELSFEGVRWNDIRRWHIAADLLARQEGVNVWNKGKAAVMPTLGGGYKSRYQATRGFWPIPQTEIDLSEGVLKQNAGWTENDNFKYTGWH